VTSPGEGHRQSIVTDGCDPVGRCEANIREVFDVRKIEIGGEPFSCARKQRLLRSGFANVGSAEQEFGEDRLALRGLCKGTIDNAVGLLARRGGRDAERKNRDGDCEMLDHENLPSLAGCETSLQITRHPLPRRCEASSPVWGAAMLQDCQDRKYCACRRARC
jgi:hypothetical protein